MKMAQDMSMHVALPIKYINPLRELKKICKQILQIKTILCNAN